jgi:hypothetical protein
VPICCSSWGQNIVFPIFYLYHLNFHIGLFIFLQNNLSKSNLSSLANEFQKTSCI